MKLGHKLVALAGLLAAAGASSAAAQTDLRVVVVEGQIRQAGTGVTLEGHVNWTDFVRISSDSASSLVAHGDGASTDSQGRYRVEMNLRADSSRGNIAAWADDHVSVGKWFEARPGQDHFTVDFELAPQVPVSGTIVDATGQPVAGATVYIAYPGQGSSGRAGESGGVQTDATGHFYLPIVRSTGRFVLEILQDEFLPAFSSALDCQGKPLRDVVVPIRFRKGVTVAGTVVDEAAHPVSGALVWIGMKADPTVDPEIARLSRSKSNRVNGGHIQVEADTQGHFEITNLPPGAAFRLTATHRNGKYTPTRLQGFRTDTAGQEMTVVLKPR